MPPPNRLILEVRWGPFSGRKTIIEPGQTVRVGRSNLADVCIPTDAKLSGKHFTLTWHGARCTVCDLAGAGGTWLQGERVGEAEVPSGAWLRAGETNLMVYFEAHTPRPWSLADRTLLAGAKTGALAALRSETTQLCGVLDASRGARVLQLLREAVDPHRSLYDGVKGEALAHAAPYLVMFRSDSGLLERLVDEGWGERWGIYFTCSRPFPEVRRHLRRFLMVEGDEAGTRFYFRYYDPKTLRLFLPASTVRQRGDFFGEFGCFIAEGASGEVLRFTPDPQRSEHAGTSP